MWNLTESFRIELSYSQKLYFANLTRGKFNRTSINCTSYEYTVYCILIAQVTNIHETEHFAREYPRRFCLTCDAQILCATILFANKSFYCAIRAFYANLQFRHFKRDSRYMQYLCKSDFQFIHENADRKRNRERDRRRRRTFACNFTFSTTLLRVKNNNNEFVSQVLFITYSTWNTDSCTATFEDAHSPTNLISASAFCLKIWLSAQFRIGARIKSADCTRSSI